MADGLFQNGLLQSLAVQQLDPIQQMAREFSQKNAYYRRILGDSIIDNGIQQYGPQFFTLLEQQLSQNPNIALSVQGSSGNFIPAQNGMDVMNTPAALNARLGMEQNGVRGGVSTMLVRMPDGSVRPMPKAYDVGYNTNAFGGNIDIGGTVVPKDGQMPKTMYNIQARYNKQF